MRKVIVVSVASAITVASSFAYSYDMTCTLTGNILKVSTLQWDYGNSVNARDANATVDLNGVNQTVDAIAPAFTWETGAPATIKATWSNKSFSMLVGATSYISLQEWGYGPLCTETRRIDEWSLNQVLDQSLAAGVCSTSGSATPTSWIHSMRYTGPGVTGVRAYPSNVTLYSYFYDSTHQYNTGPIAAVSSDAECCTATARGVIPGTVRSILNTTLTENHTANTPYTITCTRTPPNTTITIEPTVLRFTTVMGTNPEPGNFFVTVRADDGSRASGSLKFDFTANPEGQPAIKLQDTANGFANISDGATIPLDTNIERRIKVQVDTTGVQTGEYSSIINLTYAIN